MENKKEKIIPVFFTIDNSYAPYLDCAIRSMVKNASRAYSYKIYVLYENLTDLSKERIKSSADASFEIELIQMKDELEEITDRVENRLRCDYFTLTIYFRLFIADMFPQYEKGIYIDSDVVVPGDISEMYEIALGDNIIGACPDHSVVAIPELARYMEYAIGVDRKEYINSGVLLMNLKKMRETAFASRFLELLNTWHIDCIAPDQDYLNAMCSGKITFLDECWDTMPPEEGIRETLANPKLIHYNLFQKPWCYDNIPYEEYFWEYAKMSPFYEEILSHKANYSEKQKASDRDCLNALVTKAGMLDQQEITFRKLREAGVCIRIGDHTKNDYWKK